MIHLIEPKRWTDLLLQLNTRMNQSPAKVKIFPILADIFVLSYPLYLAIAYLWWKFRKQIIHKIIALQIFVWVLASTTINITIQYFFDKMRPNIVLWLTDQKTESILHKFLPSSSFPSDHAAVSMSIAVASIIRGIKKKQPTYTYIGVVLVWFSLITSFSRVTIGIHRPTDIIGWSLVGILIPLAMSSKKISKFLEEKVFTFLVKLI